MPTPMRLTLLALLIITASGGIGLIFQGIEDRARAVESRELLERSHASPEAKRTLREDARAATARVTAGIPLSALAIAGIVLVVRSLLATGF